MLAYSIYPNSCNNILMFGFYIFTFTCMPIFWEQVLFMHVKMVSYIEIYTKNISLENCYIWLLKIPNKAVLSYLTQNVVLLWILTFFEATVTSWPPGHEYVF